MFNLREDGVQEECLGDAGIRDADVREENFEEAGLGDEDDDVGKDSLEDDDDMGENSEDEDYDDIFDHQFDMQNEVMNVIEPVNMSVFENITDEDMTEFDEEAADLDDELKSLQGSDDEMGEPNLEYNFLHTELALGMKFRGAIDFRKAVRAWSIERGYSYKYKKNCRTLVHVSCKDKRCGFKIRCSAVRDTETLQIKTFKPQHTCPREYDNKLVTVQYLAQKYLEDIRDDTEWKVMSMQKKIKRELGYELPIAKCYRTRNAGIDIISGEIRKQYKRLYDYAQTIRVTNPGSTVKFKTELTLDTNMGRVPRELVVFQHMYVRFTAQRQGFFSGLRPIVCLDGCHLKDDFGTVDETNWVFMSDQQKGLIEAFKELMPNVEHRFCMKHMYENMKLRFKGLEYKQHLWNAAGAGTVKLWEHHMVKLKAFDQAAYDWVMEHDPKTWARCYFSPTTKSDALQNNMCESFNKYILLARHMPILSCVEWIRKAMMKRQYIKYTGMLRYTSDICPKYQDLLEKIKVASKNSFATPCGRKLFEVSSYNKTVVVDLNRCTCTCKMWDISGIPCIHAVSAIFKNGEKPEAYVNKYFMKSTYLAVHQHVFNPVPSHEEWEKTEYPDIHPWVVTKPPGRPKKRRIRQPDEPRNPYRVPRAGGFIRCGKCHQQGHNAKGCKAGITGESAWQRRIRKAGNKQTGVHIQGSPPKRPPGRPRKALNPSSEQQAVSSSSQPRPSAPLRAVHGQQQARGRGRGRGRTTVSTAQQMVTQRHDVEAGPSDVVRPRRISGLVGLAHRFGFVNDETQSNK
ncbi:hypothetical protein M5689_002536 [Euphorbia peplus]|nr:hypothetical protein M5689_002536 [Euphorbia peplus]